MTPFRWRSHADFLREIAAGYRARATSGTEFWRTHDLREAERLETRADYALRMAKSEEEQELEFDDA